MRKILFFSAILFSVNMATAQTDCMGFFPETQGTVLETTTYDVAKQPLRSMVYRVNEVNTNVLGNNMQVSFTMMNNDGSVMDAGNIDADCMDGNFRMKMSSRALTPEVMNILSTSTELVSNFLDYPNIFNTDMDPFASPFVMTGGDFTIQSNNDKKDDIRVGVRNRQYEGNERIYVPARRDSFDAAKVTFDFEVTENGSTKQYKGIEWYSTNFGIIRSETYDNNNTLLNTTLLTTIKEK